MAVKLGFKDCDWELFYTSIDMGWMPPLGPDDKAESSVSVNGVSRITPAQMNRLLKTMCD